MADDVFISYAHKDREFVDRLANDLHQGGAQVFFDRGDLQPGDHWRQVILGNIQGCKVFVLVISPTSVKRSEVLWELSQARAAGVRVIPVIYQTARIPKDLAEYVRQVQYVDLRHGSYADNFEALVDGLVAGDALPRPAGDRPLLRPAAPIHWRAVWGRVPGWGLAWGIGWALFWCILALLGYGLSDMGMAAFVFSYSLSGGLAGGTGGLLVGLVTMYILRHNARSIGWKHMSSSIWIWAISGPFGFVLACPISLTVFFTPLVLNSLGQVPCEGWDCVGLIINTGLVLFMVVAYFSWFIIGLLAGWLAVRRIRRMEPGITRRQSSGIMLAWAFGGAAAAACTFWLFGLISNLY